MFRAEIFLKRLGIKILAPFIIFYWFIFRPKTRGVKCLIEADGDYILIRNSYGKKRWTLPGGGIKINETPEEAAGREVFEEVGINLGDIIYLGTFLTTIHYKRDVVYCCYAKVNNKNFRIDPVEILDAKWFPKDALPRPLSLNMKKFMELYNNS